MLVTRDTTERPEAIKEGTVTLVGTQTQKIVGEAIKLLDDTSYYDSKTKLHNPYGDGKAAHRILKFIKALK